SDQVEAQGPGDGVQRQETKLELQRLRQRLRRSRQIFEGKPFRLPIGDSPFPPPAVPDVRHPFRRIGVQQGNVCLPSPFFARFGNFQHRIFRQLLLNILLQIRRGELEQLDRLPQFRRHHQFHPLLLNQTVTDLQEIGRAHV